MTTEWGQPNEDGVRTLMSGFFQVSGFIPQPFPIAPNGR